MKTAIAAMLCVISCSASCPAADHSIGRFSARDLSGWTDKGFKGKTTYALVAAEGGKTVLQAHSRGAASGLLKKISLDVRTSPMLRWSWKVERSLHREDVTRKAGDDFAARVYVVFPRTLFWQTKAINYVWAARLPMNSAVPSPYTANAMIVAVESGDERAGTWVNEERNVYEDYKKLFGEEPPPLGAVAVMTDTDDTRDEVMAWYGDIHLSSR